MKIETMQTITTIAIVLIPIIIIGLILTITLPMIKAVILRITPPEHRPQPKSYRTITLKPARPKELKTIHDYIDRSKPIQIQ